MRTIRLLALALFLTPICLTAEENLIRHHSYVLIVDTSKSMLQNTRNDLGDPCSVYASAVSRIRCFVFTLEKGDRVTLLFFDTDVRKAETVEIQSRADQTRIMDRILSSKPKGDWTNTAEMLKALLGAYEELEKMDPNDKKIAIILSDGLDDPPPVQKKHISLSEITGKTKEIKYIYAIDMSAAMSQRVKQQLEGKSGSSDAATNPPAEAKSETSPAPSVDQVKKDSRDSGKFDELKKAVPQLRTDKNSLDEIRKETEASTAESNRSYYRRQAVIFGKWAGIAVGALAVVALLVLGIRRLVAADFFTAIGRILLFPFRLLLFPFRLVKYLKPALPWKITYWNAYDHGSRHFEITGRDARTSRITLGSEKTNTIRMPGIGSKAAVEIQPYKTGKDLRFRIRGKLAVVDFGKANPDGVKPGEKVDIGGYRFVFEDERL